MQNVDPHDLHKQLSDGAELALLDVRDEGVFGESHILTASCLPANLVEMRICDLVPRRSVRLVLCDDGKEDESLARRVGALLEAHDYSQIQILAGGLAAWEAAGLELFSGVNVPSKAFGEFVEINQATPHIAASDLAERQQRNDDLVILDSRPRCRTRLPRPHCRARSIHDRCCQLRRSHTQHYWRAVIDQCGLTEPGHGTRERHDGLAPCWS